MTIGEIKNVVAAFAQRSPTDFVKNGVDMLLVAANNAQRKVQLLHDFNVQRVVAQVTVSPNTGGNIDAAWLAGDEAQTVIKIKDYDTFYLQIPANNGNPVGISPLYHNTKKGMAIWTKERMRNLLGRYNRDDIVYPADDVLRVPQRVQLEIFIHGRKLYFNPDFAEDKTVLFDALQWMAPYTADADTDWLTTYGSEYLQWAMLCEVNYLFSVFVPNLDGNLSPPEKARDRALQDLITWDDFQVEQGRQPFGIR